uniref:Uncharacterized protein n=1 Tax=Brassica campestris TaxID=3711 RepID=M4E621_BRACM
MEKEMCEKNLAPNLPYVKLGLCLKVVREGRTRAKRCLCAAPTLIRLTREEEMSLEKGHSLRCDVELKLSGRYPSWVVHTPMHPHLSSDLCRGVCSRTSIWKVRLVLAESTFSKPLRRNIKELITLSEIAMIHCVFISHLEEDTSSKLMQEAFGLIVDVRINMGYLLDFAETTVSLAPLTRMREETIDTAFSHANSIRALALKAEASHLQVDITIYLEHMLSFMVNTVSIAPLTRLNESTMVRALELANSIQDIHLDDNLGDEREKKNKRSSPDSSTDAQEDGTMTKDEEKKDDVHQMYY